MKNRAAFFIAISIQVLAAAMLLAFIYLYFVPITVIIPNIQPYKVITMHVLRGGNLVYIVDACKYIDASSRVSRVYVNVKQKTQYPAISSGNNISVGCDKTNVATVVPLFIPRGEYYLLLNVEYKVNFLRDKSYIFKTEKFIVD